MKRSKTIMVLGATGFLGSRVVELLHKTKYKIVPVTRSSGIDIRQYYQIEKIIASKKPDVILNCAGHVGSVHYVTKYAGSVIDDNIQMALNLYRAVAKVSPRSKIINPLGNCSYPGTSLIQKESQWQDGPVHDSVLAFGSVKRTQYAIAESYRKQFGIRSVNWIVCNPYGPEDNINTNKLHALNGIIVRMINAQKRGDKFFEIWGSGKPIREWLYISDAAKILVYSIDHIDEQVYPVNVAQKKGYSVKQIASLVAKELKYHVRFRINTKYPDGAPVKIMDNKLFRTKYPNFKFTPFKDGVRDTVAFFRKKILYDNSID